MFHVNQRVVCVKMDPPIPGYFFPNGQPEEGKVYVVSDLRRKGVCILGFPSLHCDHGSKDGGYHFYRFRPYSANSNARKEASHEVC